MLLTRTRALASATILSAIIGSVSPAGSDPTDLKTLLAGISSEPGPATGPAASLSASEAVVHELYGSLGGASTPTPGADVSQPARSDAAANPFAPAPAGASPVAAPAANPFALPADLGVPSAGSQTDAATSTPASAFEIAPEPASADEADGGIDESALRYYAAQRNLERVGAEIRRLKALHPEWTPPADLFAPRSDVDEQPVWDLYAAGRFEEARRLIASLEQEKPSYRPSADLVSKLDEAQARSRIRTASEAKDWSEVLQAASKSPAILVCTNMDVLWSVGEAFAATGDLARSFDLYSYILANCSNEEERLATVQKAALTLPQEGIDALITHGRRLPNGEQEFASMRFEVVRAALGKAIEGDDDVALDPDEMDAFVAYVRQARSADDAALLGWYSYDRQDYDEAVNWFSLAGQIDPTPKNVEGAILALRNRGDVEEAEALAFDARERSEELAKIYIEIVADRLNDEESEPVDERTLERFASVVEDSRSALGAQTLGWHLLAEEETDEAEDWFARSVEWEPTEEGVLGLAVVASRQKDNARLKAIKSEYGERFAALADIKDYRPVASGSRSYGRAKNRAKRGGGGGGDRLMRQANALYDAGHYEQALAVLNKRESRSGKTYGAEILRGWANIKLHRYDQAEQIFRRQDSRRSTKDTRFGIGAIQNFKYNMWPHQRNDCKIKWKC